MVRKSLGKYGGNHYGRGLDNSRKRRQRKKGGDEITKAYVINLDKRTDRWEKIQERFKNSSIVLERVSAIVNENGHEGFKLSMQKIIKMAKDNNLPTVFFMEDDCKPVDNFDLRWKTTKDWLDANLDKWDIFNGGADINSKNSKQYNVKYRLA